MKGLSQLGGDECDNLNFVDIKIDSFKIRKNSRVVGNFKIRIFNLRFTFSVS